MRERLSPAQVAILAPATLHREAWRSLLAAQPGIRILGAVGDAKSLPALLSGGRPAAVLVDLGSPDEESVRRIKEHVPEWGLLLLVQHYAQGEIVGLLKAGASGFVCREESVGDLARSVIAVARGEIVLPQALAAGTLAALARGGPPPSPLLEHISDREAEVLRLLARGLTNKDIAQSLVISVRTVEAHLRNVYSKLEVRSRTEAALWAIRHGYGPESPAKST